MNKERNQFEFWFKRFKRYLFDIKYYLNNLNPFKIQPTVYILTRFNVDITHVNSLINQEACRLDEKYLNERFRLFEKYCLPSILNQSDKNFKYLVFFHPQTPDKFKERIKYYTNTSNGIFIPFYTKNAEMPHKIAEQINNDVEKGWIITARIDNDDALAFDFVDKIKKYFVPINNTILNFEHGIKYIEYRDIYYEDIYPAGSHFLAKIYRKKAHRKIM